MENILARDYILLVDASSSMTLPYKRGEDLSRWNYVKEAAYALAVECEKVDPDGIELYTFASKVKALGSVKSNEVNDLFEANEPFGRTNLTAALEQVFDNWDPEVPATIVVITDGQPDNANTAAEAIVRVTRRMDADEQLAITFIQVGDDTNAKNFLKFLDDQLTSSMGAEFDIVDTIDCDAMMERPLSETLIAAISD